MRNIQSLLERFTKLLNKDDVLKENISSVIKERSKVELDKNKIVLKNGVLELDLSPVAKNEIRLKEESIKDELSEVYKIKVTRVLYK